jgi:hypothetical protein
MKTGVEWQVCNLELSKRLRELGVKQESEFQWADLILMSVKAGDKKSAPVKRPYWHIIHFPNYPKTGNEPNEWYELSGKEMIAAFTVAELGEMLPESRFPTGEWIEQWKYQNTFGVELKRYADMGAAIQTLWSVNAHTEADARAKMFCYLLGNKLI